MVAFEASVVAIGIVGGIANFLMLLILVQSKARKYEMGIVFNQMTLDFLSCSFLVITYVLKILDIDYNITMGRFLCKTLTSEGMLWYFLGCSTANLVVLTLERYVKIVHAMFHKKHFRRWMYFVAIALTWVNFDVVIGLLISDVSDGRCLAYATWPPGFNTMIYAVYRFLITFLFPLVVFVFCYSRILKVTQKRILPVNFNNMMKSAAQQNAMKTQMNVIKTFLIISVCFVLCWFPTRLIYFLYNLHIIKNLSTDGRNVTVFLAFLNVCLNPFIYAANLDPVKKYLRQKLCHGRRHASDETVATVSNTIGDSTAVKMRNHT